VTSQSIENNEMSVAKKDKYIIFHWKIIFNVDMYSSDLWWSEHALQKLEYYIRVCDT